MRDGGYALATTRHLHLPRSVERFSQFLTLVGLTALIVGGVGVANAVRAFLETKRPVIASLKSLGAPGRFIFQLYMIQILLMAAIGIAAGLVLAILMPYAARWALGGFLPVSEGALFFPQALAPGILFGLLTTLIFFNLATCPVAGNKTNRAFSGKQLWWKTDAGRN